ncbi:hypothetical protein VHEMI04288 [[Torrubiella] hemipterigena]|uniref:Zn(2)-C6 fungal-type domain-containing protein n=1 Tax=[Torrubiella] hemipterigena TaxID=1531966 RepID=A0A0A1SUW4_9HYPO|nr:hypothetical protein VHEMI04288 [[Torrubiella] hemipterigena]
MTYILASKGKNSVVVVPSRPVRQKRFTHKTKTGCAACRRRRIKCNEARPVCHRCVRSGLECVYPQSTAHIESSIPLFPQPSTTLCPIEVEPNGQEVDIFGAFRSSIVGMVGGSFNQSFWLVDVPRAAQMYPSIWHAAIALTAIHHCAKSDQGRIRYSAPGQPVSHLARNNQYTTALVHFNKSLRYLSEAVAQYRDNTPYMQKEMIIITNMIYIGICSILEDTKQTTQHRINLIRLLEHWRFGEDDPVSRHGVLTYDDLLSILLVIDGNMDASAELPHRQERPWAVQLPTHAGFTSTTQAYMGLLPFLYHRLYGKEHFRGPGFDGPGKFATRRRLLASYVAKLDHYERSTKYMTTHDLESLKTIRLILKVYGMKEELLRKETRESFVEEQRRIYPILGEIDELLAQTSPLAEPFSTTTPPVNFSLRPFCAIHLLLEVYMDGYVVRRSLELFQKWPFNDVGETSFLIHSLYLAKQKFEVGGPERTMSYQKSGLPINPTYPFGGLEEGEFDGCSGCECIAEVFVCIDHRVREHKVRTIESQQFALFRCVYESRNDLPWTSFLLDY